MLHAHTVATPISRPQANLQLVLAVSRPSSFRMRKTLVPHTKLYCFLRIQKDDGLETKMSTRVLEYRVPLNCPACGREMSAAQQPQLSTPKILPSTPNKVRWETGKNPTRAWAWGTGPRDPTTTQTPKTTCTTEFCGRRPRGVKKAAVSVGPRSIPTRLCTEGASAFLNASERREARQRTPKRG